MANVKYRVREFRPSTNQPGTHSFFAESVIDNTIDNQNLADKIAARTGFKTCRKTRRSSSAASSWRESNAKRV